MRRALAVFVVSLFVSLPAPAATLLVNDLGDAPDAMPGDGVCATSGSVCTLRAAMTESNALTGIDTIQMTVAGTIELFTPLPDIRDSVAIDGTTAPGYASAPVVIVDGRAGVDNIFVLAASSRLTGLEIHGFNEVGVLVRSGGTSFNVVERCYIGAISGGGPGRVGVLVEGGLAQIGSPVPGGGNVIGRNLFGILDDSGAGTKIMNNFIGTDALGTPDIGNIIGIRVTGARTKIGLDASTFNVISGNASYGILIEGSEVVIGGNRIGTDVTGLSAIPNANAGIYDQGRGGTQIGTPEYPNIISGNDGPGVLFDGYDATIENNWIGIGADGTTAVPNDTGVAVTMDSLRPFRHASISSNVISGNDGEGIVAGPNAAYVTIENNYIGLNATGNVAVPNIWNGISLTGGSNFTLRANTVSGNRGNGIRLDAAGLLTVEGNRLGTDASGTAALPNGESGIELHGVTNAALADNVISGNALAGVEINGTSSDVTLSGNVIGRTAGNLAPLPNAEEGIRVTDDATGITIGAPGSGNVIASNSGTNGGVFVTGNATGFLRANSIFDNATLGIDLGVPGVTSNDVLDADSGPNGSQNFPLLTTALTSPAASSVSGTVNSTPSTPITLDFFANTVADSSGHGEGQTYLGSLDTTTDASGDAAFTFSGPALTPGTFIAATATSGTGTSEFSPVIAAVLSPAVAFSSATYSVDESGGTAIITVTRTGDLTVTSTVNYATSDGTASSGSDFTAASGTLTFAPGVATQTFAIALLDDATHENDETLTLTLSSPSFATLGNPAIATLTITNDDPVPAITIGDVSVSEGDAGLTAMTFIVSLSSASDTAATVDFATADITATGGSDYGAATGTLTIAPGETSASITVSVDGDTSFEPDETLTIDLTNPVNASLSDAHGTGTIVNDDTAAADLTITKTAPISATEGDNITYTIAVANTGPDVATNVVMTDVLPTGATFVSATTSRGVCNSGTTVTCNSAALAVGSAMEISITVQATTSGTISNTATVTATEADPNPPNNASTATTTVADAAGAIAELTITKTAPATVAAGEDVVYRIVVANAGPALATNVVITDVLPVGTSFVSATVPAGSCSGSATVTCTVGTLAVGGSVEALITLQAGGASTITNTATVTASEADPDAANNASAATTTVGAAAALASIPTLSESMLVALATLLAAAAMLKMHS